MKTTLPLILFLFCFHIGYNQSDFKLLSKWDYERKDKPHEKINEIIPTSFGYIVAVGETLSDNLQDRDGLFLVIRAEDGKEQFRKTFPKKGDQSFNAVVQNHNGTFTLVGYSQRDKKATKNGWMLIVDWHGKEILNEEVLQDKNFDEEIYDIAINKTGQVVAIASQENRKTKRFLALNIKGKEIKTKELVNTGMDNFSCLITSAIDQQFVLLGNTPVSRGAQGQDVALVKINAQGEDLWGSPKYFGGKGFQSAKSIANTQDGGYIFVGANSEIGAGLTDYWIVKLNNRGVQQWEKIYGGKADEEASSIFALSANAYAVFGQTKSYMIKAPTSMQEMLLLDMGGQIIDKSTYPIIAGDGNEIASDVIEMHNNDLIFAGNSISEKNGAAIMQIGAYIYKPFVRQPNKVKLPGAPKEERMGSGSKSNSDISSLRVSQAMFTDANGNSLLEANERGYYTVDVTNTGSATTNNISSKIIINNAPEALDFKADLYLGSLRAGETKTLHIPVHAKAALSNSNYEVDINLTVDGALSTSTKSNLKSQLGAEPARLVVDAKRFYPGTNPRPGQLIRLDVEVINVGGLASRPIEATFRFPTGVESAKSERQMIPTLSPTKKHILSINFSYNNNFQGREIPISFDIPGNTQQTIKLAIPNNQAAIAKTANPTRNNGTIPDEMVWASHDPDRNRTRAVDVNTGEVNVKVVALSKQPLDKKNFNLLINGKKTKGQKNFGEVDLTPPSNSSGRNRQTYSNRVKLEPGLNTVQIVYDYDNENGFRSEEITFNYIPKNQPSLYVLSIGVTQEDLSYTVKDAEDIYNAFNRLKGEGGFKKVRAYSLTTQETTTERNIKRAFVDLSREKINENDLVVVFMSTHGKISQRNRYILLPSDFENDYETETSIDFQDDILSKLDMINANVLVLIDACQSGGAYDGARSAFSSQTTSTFMNKLINTTSGMEIIASCRAKEFSYEDHQWRNGAFTKAILEAFRNTKVPVSGGQMIQADIFNEFEEGAQRYGSDGIITLEELRIFIDKRVPHLVRTVKGKDQNPSHKSTERLSKKLGIYMVN